jgi:RNA polymerase sigma-70 factor (sigma-E family)
VWSYVKPIGADGAAAAWLPGHSTPESAASSAAAAAVSLLYEQMAVSLIRLAFVILSDRQAAEDVVQDAFCSLYRRWDRLADPAGAAHYVRASVINGCRSALRRRSVRNRKVLYELPAASAEAAILGHEERAELIRAVDRLPDRQREALVLRFYLDLPDEEIAALMHVRPGTVRSTIHRALAALGQTLREAS